MAGTSLSVPPLLSGLLPPIASPFLTPPAEETSSDSQAQIHLLLLQILTQLNLHRECFSTLDVLQREKAHWDYKEDQLLERLFRLKKEKRIVEGSISDLQYENQELRNGKCNDTGNCPTVTEKKMAELRSQLRNERERAAELEAQQTSQTDYYEAKLRLAERDVDELKAELKQKQRKVLEREEALQKCPSESELCIQHAAADEPTDSKNKIEEFFNFLQKNNIDVHTTVSSRKWTPLHLAAAYGDNTTVEVILQRGANVDAVGSDDVTPLMMAADRGNFQVLQKLLEKNASVDKKDSTGNSALHRAAYNDHGDVVRELIMSGGLGINVANDFGEFPLHQAAYLNNIEAVRALLESGVPVDPRDRKNDTPLHSAAYQGNLEIVKLLVRNNADLSLENSEGLTPLDLATNENHSEVVDYLTATTNGA